MNENTENQAISIACLTGLATTILVEGDGAGYSIPEAYRQNPAELENIVSAMVAKRVNTAVMAKSDALTAGTAEEAL